jgi:phosphoglycolate phosphatase-like HAD superfamily hydrolase
MPFASDALSVIVDLDGPILDGRWRHYQCYQEILASYGLPVLPVDTYWRMKRQGVCVKDQLAATGAGHVYEQFKAAWLTRIEAPEMLALDRLQEGASETLRRWRDLPQVRLVLATLRQQRGGVQQQLDRFGLGTIWESIVVCTPQPAAGKSRMVADALGRSDGRGCLWIGDTEVDVDAARDLGCPVWVVSCGVRDRAFLEKVSPDHLSTAILDIDLTLYMPAHQRT